MPNNPDICCEISSENSEQTKKTVCKSELLKHINELIDFQQATLLSVGNSLVPGITSDDLLQPNDFPQLENNPYFRYEEGILAGLLTVRAALLNLFKKS